MIPPEWLPLVYVIVGTLSALAGLDRMGLLDDFWHNLRRMGHLLTWLVRRLTRRTPRVDSFPSCTCPVRVARANEPVPITSVVTGEVLDHRCPVCWLPRNPYAAPVMALDSLPAEAGYPIRSASVGPHRMTYRGGVANDPQGPGFTGGSRMSTGDAPPPRHQSCPTCERHVLTSYDGTILHDFHVPTPECTDSASTEC